MTQQNTLIDEATAKKSAHHVEWDLSDLFSGPDDPKIRQVMDQTIENSRQFKAQYSGQLNQLSPQQIKQCVQELEAFLTPLYHLGQYSGLLMTTNMSDDTAKKLEFEVDNVQTTVSNELVFFDLEIGKFSKEKVTECMEDQGLNPFHYMLKRTVETAKYNLSEPEERLSNLKDLSGVDGFKKLYEEWVASFEFEMEIDGKKRTMNGSEIRNLRLHPDPQVRREAMQLFLSRYQDNKIIFSHIFNNILKDFHTEKNLRGYSSAISRRNIGNDLPDSLIQLLHDVTRDSYRLVQRYYRLKSKILNLKPMTLSDIYAPIPESDRYYTWDQAKSIVLECFEKFDTDFAQKAQMLFDQNRIHAPIQKNKRGGAFCSGSTPDKAPYVMVNFMGKSRDIATLAHELGHAVHDLYASKQPLTYYHPILPLAETASVFAEMTVTDHLLKIETSKQARISLLMDKIEDLIATSHRQNMFSSFEQNVHKQIETKLISADEFCKMYQDELKAMFGDAVEIPEIYHWEWAAIPHIFEWPFYVYAYNFGNLLVMALYQTYKEGQNGFHDAYKALLSAGSSASPISIMAEAGIDITQPEFWKKSLASIETLIDQLDELVD